MSRAWLLVTGLVVITGCTGGEPPSKAAPEPQPLGTYADAWLKSDTLWEITGTHVGGITPKSTVEDLKRLYGEENVVPGEFYFAEGFCEPGTVLFPHNPEKTVEIDWGDNNAQAFPKVVQMMGDRSVWKTPEGIGLGTSGIDLIRLNGSPFTFAGIGWDYGGYVHTWGEGALARSLAENMSVRLDMHPLEDESLSEFAMAISGEQEVTSDQLEPVADKVFVSKIFGVLSGKHEKIPG